MASRKRRFEEDSLHIRLAAADGDAGPLVADRAILTTYSSCVRGLPVESTEWDISKFVIEGQAVGRPIVLAWLNAVYMHVLDEPFEQQKVNPASSMRGMALLLGFADAVGSSRGLLRSLSADLNNLVATVHLDKLPSADLQQQQQDQEQTEQQPQPAVLKLHTTAYYWWTNKHTLTQRLNGVGPSVVADVGTAARRAALSQQAAGQVEALLYHAYNLQLPALQQQLHGFIQINTHSTTSLLYGVMALVISDRVVRAAAERDFCKKAVINNIVTQQGSMLKHRHAEALLQPVGAIPRVDFCALLARDAFGCKQGDKVSAILLLDGGETDGEPAITINGQNHVVQLLVGPYVRDDASMQAIMGPPPASVDADGDC